MQAKDRIIAALDVPELDESARKLIRELTPYVGHFKVGATLIARGGHLTAADAVGDAGRIMLDPKLHDIPAQVAGAMRAYADLGFGFCTVHASGHEDMLKAAVEHCGDTRVLAVTALTSLDDRMCRDVYGDLPDAVVYRLAKIASVSGVHGIVCSAKEVTDLRGIAERNPEALASGLTCVTPGIRVPTRGQTMDDQRRVTTPGGAVLNGSDLLVIGRDLMRAEERHGISPVGMARRIAEEIEEALS